MSQMLRSIFSCFTVCFLTCCLGIFPALAAESENLEIPLNQYGIRSTNPYVVNRLSHGGKLIDEIIVPGSPTPPKEFLRAEAVNLPQPNISGTANILTNVPALSWSFGCSATSAAMMFGYYDNHGYSNMYAGPTNGGVFPMTNASWGSAIINGETRDMCPLSATRNGLDGRVIRGHVDDYWIAYGNAGPDPFITNAWTEHTKGECTADYMGTNQSSVSSSDGSTTFYNYQDGSPLYDYTGAEPSKRDGCHGMRLFAESRGYTVTSNFSQYIYGYNGNTLGFTFADFKAEIDAGRPVMIQVTGHTMLGYGYDDATSTIYIHDTWDYSNHSMTWGGSYSGMQHYAVTVLRLAPVPNYTLSVNLTGSGAGTVSSVPSGISCASGSCSHDFASGTSVALTPTASTGSVVGNWGGDCSGSGSCILNMTMARSATATFDLIPKARIGGTPYGTLSSAYSAVGAGGVIQSQALTFVENLIINRSVDFTLKGGYADGYGSQTGFTTLDGNLSIGSGRMIVERLVVK